jgi:integrase
MGRKRRRDKHLPTSVYHRHGAYYFVDKDGKWNRLGRSLGEAYRELAHFVEAPSVKTVDDLCVRYRREVLPSYSKKEQKNRTAHLERIQAVFGKMTPSEVREAHVRAFRDRIGQRKGRDWGRPQLALKALATFSHVFTWAAEWDYVAKNPCLGVKRPPQPRRKRYATDAEFDAVYCRCPAMHQIAMDIALLTGLRRGDILRLNRASVTEDGLIVPTSKTSKPLMFKWSFELKATIDRALAVQPRVRRHIICNKQGRQYTPDGFSTIWRRAMKKAMVEGDLGEPFRFNDIRAKSASDDENADRASLRLGHTSRQTTERYYLRKAKEVDPLR